MAPKPRSRLNQHGIDNLHIKHDKRTDKFYAQYRDPRDGKFHGLGGDKSLTGPGIQKAKDRAKQLNALIAKQIADHRVNTILGARPAKTGLTLSGWLVTYRKILDKRLEDGDIKRSTCVWIKGAANTIDKALGNTALRAITVKQIADWIKTYKDQGKSRMGQRMRTTLIDIFTEAVQAGEMEENPAKVTSRPRSKVKRARLTLDVFNSILSAAKEHLDPWVSNTMLLALLTGQRREDIGKMMFRDFQDGYLQVVQKKTGARVKIPESLTLHAIGMSLDDIKRRCRDNTVSPYVIHHSKTRGTAKRGDRVGAKRIAEKFAEARDLAGLTWGDSTPPPFHEIRSLAERLYDAEGVDTQSLLGHKSAKMTEEYHDARGFDWVVVKTK